MQFKHPEFLYALVALVIPLLVHLFQLRRFQKVYFSNVAFLQTVTTQTRKSSQLKKWLVLCTRMLLFACIIIAFAQPYFASKINEQTKNETVIYLDNSFSMQAKGPRGPLVKRAVQELISALPSDEKFSLFTNTDIYPNVTLKTIQNDLVQLEYSPNQLSYETVYLKAKQLLSKTKSDPKSIIMISDFQKKERPLAIPNTDSTTTIHLVQLQPVTANNIAIDSLALQRDPQQDLKLWVQIQNTGTTKENIPIACYDGDVLLGKTSIPLSPNTTAQTHFVLNEHRSIQGKVVIEDPNLSFDNTYYFSLNTPKKIKVIVISDDIRENQFLSRIYTPDEFDFSSNTLRTLNYNEINTAHLVILNELNHIPVSILNVLKNHTERGGIISLIPSAEGDLESYNRFLTTQNTQFSNPVKESRKITTIHFSAPLFKGVFENTVKNFQYPKVNSYFTPKTSAPSILTFDNETPFLFKSLNTYIFTAPLNATNANFQNSPLIVPTFYNIGKQSLELPDLYYTVGRVNTYDVATTMEQDGILSLFSTQESCIPLQQSFTNKVQITTEETPTRAGIYTIQNKKKTLQHVSYNYTAQESITQYYDLSSSTDAYHLTDSVASLFHELKEAKRVHEIWKWFVIFALLFLGIEILLLNYLK